jgi:predicted nucleic acid-binding protein
MMRIYGDSVIPIYYFEGAPPFKARAMARLTALWGSGDVLVISDLVRLECRMLPIRLGDAARVADFDRLFAQPNVELAPMTAAVFDRATHIRAVHNFRLGDSLHLAAAVQSRCDRFLTHDLRLSAFTAIPVEALP